MTVPVTVKYKVTNKGNAPFSGSVSIAVGGEGTSKSIYVSANSYEEDSVTINCPDSYKGTTQTVRVQVTKNSEVIASDTTTVEIPGEEPKKPLKFVAWNAYIDYENDYVVFENIRMKNYGHKTYDAQVYYALYDPDYNKLYEGKVSTKFTMKPGKEYKIDRFRFYKSWFDNHNVRYVYFWLYNWTKRQWDDKFKATYTGDSIY